MQTELVRTTELAIAQKAEMYALLSRHFAGATKAIFETDLTLKNWVLLLKDELKDDGQQLQGFSTLLMYDVVFEGETLTIVYSGDTIMDPSAWSSSALPAAWIAAINQLKSNYEGSKLYWLLISSGFRTYRFLPTFWQSFYPRHDAATPEKSCRLMNFLCQRQFGDWYESTTGLVKFPTPQKLKAHLTGIPVERLHNPHIQFFAAQNPGYAEGDELVCLTEISEQNLTRAGRRMWTAKKPKALSVRS